MFEEVDEKIKVCGFISWWNDEKCWWIDEKVKVCGWWIDEVLETLMNWWKSEIVWVDELMNLRKKMMKSAYLKPRSSIAGISPLRSSLLKYYMDISNPVPPWKH